MKVFLAGASGAIGRRLVPLLLRAGHEVTGTTRSAQTAKELERAGVTPAVLDIFDAPKVMGRGECRVVRFQLLVNARDAKRLRRFCLDGYAVFTMADRCQGCADHRDMLESGARIPKRIVMSARHQ